MNNIPCGGGGLYQGKSKTLKTNTTFYLYRADTDSGSGEEGCEDTWEQWCDQLGLDSKTTDWIEILVDDVESGKDS